MALKLPTRTSPSVVELLTLLKDVKAPGLSRDEIIQKASAKNKNLIDSAVTNCVFKRWLKAGAVNGTTKKAYTLSEDGKAILNHLPNMTIDSRSLKRKNNAKKTKGEVVPRKELEVEEMPVNISTEANRFADFASDLVTQNAHYRSVLLEIHTIIGKLLFPETKDEQ